MSKNLHIQIGEVLVNKAGFEKVLNTLLQKHSLPQQNVQMVVEYTEKNEAGQDVKKQKKVFTGASFVACVHNFRIKKTFKKVKCEEFLPENNGDMLEIITNFAFKQHGDKNRVIVMNVNGEYALILMGYPEQFNGMKFDVNGFKSQAIAFTAKAMFDHLQKKKLLDKMVGPQNKKSGLIIPKK